MNQMMSAFLVHILPIILLVGIVSILATAFRVFVLPRLKGRLGEASINFWAKRLLDQHVYQLIPIATGGALPYFALRSHRATQGRP